MDTDKLTTEIRQYIKNKVSKLEREDRRTILLDVYEDLEDSLNSIDDDHDDYHPDNIADSDTPLYQDPDDSE